MRQTRSTSRNTASHQVKQNILFRMRSRPFLKIGAEAKFLVWGQTDAADYLQVVFVFLPDAEVDVRPMRPHDHAEFLTGAPVVYVIHAMPLNRHKKGRLKNRKKRRDVNEIFKT